MLAEADFAKNYCGEVPFWKMVYECDCIARKAFDHRLSGRTDLAAGSTTEFKDPFSVTLNDKDFTISTNACVSMTKLEAWGASQAQSLGEQVAQCTGRELVTLFKQRPGPMQMIRRHLGQAMGTCRTRR